MAKSANLGAAKNAKQDEFYTQLSDIEKEMRHYRRHFKDKTILCNCDDPFESNFFKFFVLNFNRLGLKKVIATCYSGSPIAGKQLSLFDVLGDSAETRNKPYKAVVTSVYDKTGDGGVDMFDVAELFKSHENELTELDGDGDFRSAECLSLLDEADIVATNPPFSLFREYVTTLMEHKKDFIIIGNQNAITYKDIFLLMQENKMWLGAPFQAGNAYFYVPEGADTSQYAKGVFDPETRRVKFRNCCLAKHQHDPSAVSLWNYFRSVIDWVQAIFPKYRKEMKGLPWGLFYNEHKDRTDLDPKALEADVSRLMADEDVTKKSGVYEYLLTGQERCLSIRAFDDRMKRAAYERQGGVCPYCGEHFELSEMHADHIKPWAKGGPTTAENCQMLCRDCNLRKSDD